MDNKTPILFPYDPEQFMKSMSELIHKEMAAIEKKQVQYDVPGMTVKPLYKVDEVCAMFTVSRQTLYAWRNAGILKPKKIRSRVYYLWSDLEALFKEKNIELRNK